MKLNFHSTEERKVVYIWDGMRMSKWDNVSFWVEYLCNGHLRDSQTWCINLYNDEQETIFAFPFSPTEKFHDSIFHERWITAVWWEKDVKFITSSQLLNHVFFLFLVECYVTINALSSRCQMTCEHQFTLTVSTERKSLMTHRWSIIFRKESKSKGTKCIFLTLIDGSFFKAQLLRASKAYLNPDILTSYFDTLKPLSVMQKDHFVFKKVKIQNQMRQ